MMSADGKMVPGLASMIIPTRNRAALLTETLNAASNQSYQPLEIIIVDDASTDRTDEVIRKAMANDSRIRSLRQPEQTGAAAARNAGAALARGEYLLFEDDDCRGVEDRVALLVDALKKDPGAALAYCWMQVIEAGTAMDTRGVLGPWSIGTPYALIRTTSFQAAGGFDENLPRLQDFDLWTRLLHQRHAVEVPEVLFQTLRDGSGISASKNKLRTASRRLLVKYRDSELSQSHRARMHRILGGRLVVEGMRSEGLAHYRRAIRLNPGDVRSWLGLFGAALGSAVYRSLVSLQGRVARRTTRVRVSGDAPAPVGSGSTVTRGEDSSQS